MSEQKPRKNPLMMFFSLGDKVTKGNPVTKAKFDYSFMWILFSAFVILFLRNFTLFVTTWEVGYLPWTLMGLAISWFQYYALKQFYHVKENMIKLHSGQLTKPAEPIVEDTVSDMMEEFN